MMSCLVRVCLPLCFGHFWFYADIVLGWRLFARRSETEEGYRVGEYAKVTNRLHGTTLLRLALYINPPL